jgi:hypothetical protein
LLLYFWNGLHYTNRILKYTDMLQNMTSIWSLRVGHNVPYSFIIFPRQSINSVCVCTHACRYTYICIYIYTHIKHMLYKFIGMMQYCNCCVSKVISILILLFWVWMMHISFWRILLWICTRYNKSYVSEKCESV